MHENRWPLGLRPQSLAKSSQRSSDPQLAREGKTPSLYPTPSSLSATRLTFPCPTQVLEQTVKIYRIQNSYRLGLYEPCELVYYGSIYTVRQKKLHRFIFAIALSELHLL